jgi:hypothetical protein
MIGNFVIKTVGVLFFRADRSVSINLSPHFIDELHQHSDDTVYDFVRSRVNGYFEDKQPAADSPKTVVEQAHYISMAILVHYTNNFPGRAGIRKRLAPSA